MTQETYRELHNIGMPKGKHCKKLYHVWIVLAPNGPVVEDDIWGLEEAIASTHGAWDHRIVRVMDGAIM